MKRLTKRRESDGELIIERKTLGAYDILRINRNSCIGCSICVKICPQEAINISKAVVWEGKIREKGIIDLDLGKCTFCGACAVLCPVNAIERTRNGNLMIPVVDSEVFPTLLKNVTVYIDKCDPSCMFACKESCPTGAITITSEKDTTGKVSKILNVDVDDKKCIFCQKCEMACPKAAIRVAKPFQGSIDMKTELCPKNCQACVEICPSKAIKFEGTGVKIEKEYCIYCGACQQVCPEKAVQVTIKKVLYKPIMSGAWITTLKKLITEEQLKKELNVNSVKKSVEAVEKIL